jgi:hypothetical protein
MKGREDFGSSRPFGLLRGDPRPSLGERSFARLVLIPALRTPAVKPGAFVVGVILRVRKLVGHHLLFEGQLVPILQEPGAAARAEFVAGRHKNKMPDARCQMLVKDSADPGWMINR